MTAKFIFSQRTQWDLASNPISEILSTLKKDNVGILDLTESNPTRCQFDYPKDEILKALSNKKNLVYSPSAQGPLDVREAVAGYYQRKGLPSVSPESIFLTSSTSEAYSYIFRLIANPNDVVFFPQPSYPLFQFLGEINDVKMFHYDLKYDGMWSIALQGFREVPRLKAIVVVNPNNPTGSFVKEKEKIQLSRMCANQPCAIISDEVFHDYALADDIKPVSMADNTEALTFTLGGLSKALGLPQMKLSWIVLSGPPHLVEDSLRRLEVIADTYLSVNTPTLHACQKWFQCKEAIQSSIKERLKKNLQALQSLVQKTSVCELMNVEGGWYAVLKAKRPIDEQACTITLLKDRHVYVHPGYFYDFPEEGYFVVSLLPKTADFTAAVKILLEVIGSQG